MGITPSTFGATINGVVDELTKNPGELLKKLTYTLGLATKSTEGGNISGNTIALEFGVKGTVSDLTNFSAGAVYFNINLSKLGINIGKGTTLGFTGEYGGSHNWKFNLAVGVTF